MKNHEITEHNHYDTQGKPITALEKKKTHWDVYAYTTQNLLRISFSTVCYFCVFVINMKIDLKELHIISASCTWQIDNLSTQ